MNKFSINLPGKKAAAEEPIPAWRADFRDKDELPDVKVIRTDFVINYGVAALAFVLLSGVLYREYNYMGMRSDISALTEEIESRKAADLKNLKESGLFSAYSKYIEEFINFNAKPLEAIRVLSGLSEIKSEGVVVKNILVDGSVTDPKTKKNKLKVVLVGTVKGTEKVNYDQVQSTWDRFLKSPLWAQAKAYKVTPATPVISTNRQDSVIDFTFELTLEPL